MTKRALASLTLALLTTAALAQPAPPPPPPPPLSSPAPASSSAADTTAPASPTTPPAFELADVHSSPHSNQPFFRGGQLFADRYTIHQATMVDLIANAYSLDAVAVLGGPSWLELDRFDISARAPRGTSPDDLRLMLRALLAGRFHLVTHTDTKPVPALVLSLGKGKPKLKPTDGAGTPGCQFQAPPGGPTARPTAGLPPSFTFSCHNQTMAAFVQFIRQYTGEYPPRPAVDQTGLPGAYDFDIHFSFQGGPANPDAITIYQAVDEQLGLKLEAKAASIPVIVVDKVDEKPTPNDPGIDKTLPPLPPATFDVAVINPSNPDSAGGMLSINGGQFRAQGMTLQFLITWAWGINNQVLAGAPKWLNQDKFDILAKVNADPTGPQPGQQFNFDELQHMIQALIIERFNLKTHTEDQPQDAYTLLAANPKLKKADPDNRSGCKNGPGPDGKDPRIANPILSRLVTCLNVTLDQFAELLQPMATGYLKFPVLNATGIQGSYDFTLSFSTAGAANASSAPPPTSGDASSTTSEPAADPSGAISLPDALLKTYGLKLVKERRPEPVIVIDHVDEKPTEN
jgi:uncharacterized protein (TIGR03435 family)